jgi:hypothetical protein
MSRLTTRRQNLLMATQHDTGGGEAVPLDLSDPQVKILQGTLTTCLEGVSGDLKTPDLVPDPNKARREAGAYTRLLTALDQGRIVVPDDAAREAVEAMVLSVEEDTDYAEIIAEHDALFGLLSLLGGGVVAKER